MGQLDRILSRTGTPDPTAPAGAISVEHRAMLEAEAKATLADIAALQTTTRTRDGRIKRAKFKSAVLALRWEGFSPTETAQVLGVSINRVRNALSEMRKTAAIDQQLDRLDQIAVPLAVDNVIRGVMDGDKDYTRDVLNGRGVYRTHKSIEAQVRQTTLRMDIAVTLPLAPDGQPGGALSTVRPGGVLAAPDLPVVDLVPVTVETT
jgi:predicted transcriptional regulator